MSALSFAQEDTVNLVFRQFDPPNEIEALEQVIESWNAGHPDIQVRLENISASEYVSQYVREVQAGGGPDIQHVGFVVTTDLARNGQALNLNPLIDNSPPGDGIEDFIALDLATYDGNVYGIPWSADTFTLAYNPDAFEEAGVEAPDTWQDLRAVAQELTRDTDGNGRIDQFGFCFPAGGGPQSGIWFIQNYYLWSHGHFLYEEAENGDWRVGVTPEQVTEAMSYFNGFFEDGSIPSSLIAVDNWADAELTGGLARGDCAIGFLPPISFRAAEEQAGVPLATALMPRGDESRISHIGGRSLVINPNSEHPEAAYEFIQYLVSPEVFETYNQYPAQSSLIESMSFPESEQGYVEMFPLGITFAQYVSAPPPVTAVWASTNREYQAVFSGQKSAEAAAQDLVAELESLLREYQ